MMKLSPGVRAKCTLIAFCLAVPFPAFAADPAASGLAGKVRAKENGSNFIRIRMGSGNEALQLQIKSRVSAATSDIVYQILFPKERKGESVLLHRSGGKFSGTLFAPPDSFKSIEMNQALFGSDLSYEDIIDSPFAWA